MCGQDRQREKRMGRSRLGFLGLISSVWTSVLTRTNLLDTRRERAMSYTNEYKVFDLEASSAPTRNVLALPCKRKGLSTAAEDLMNFDLRRALQIPSAFSSFSPVCPRLFFVNRKCALRPSCEHCIRLGRIRWTLM